MTKVILNVEPLGCPSCARKVEAVLESEKAIFHVTVLAQLGKIRMEYNENQTTPEHIKDILAQTGFPVLSEGGRKS